MPHPNIFILILAILFGITFVTVFLTIFGTITSRLLGVRQPWWRMLLAMWLGSTVGAGFAEAVGVQRLGNAGAPLVLFSSILVAAMLFMVAFEILWSRPLAERGARGRRAGVPHPIRAVRRRLARWSRYLQITGIIARYGLGPLPQPTAPAGLAGPPRRRPADAAALGARAQCAGRGGRRLCEARPGAFHAP
jgi:hypothetical protein